MDFVSVHHTSVYETCPRASDEGFYTPNENQASTLISRDGRLNTSLRNDSIVVWGDAAGTLATAAAFLLLTQGHASAARGFGGADNPDLPYAIADLAVTGARAYASFVQAATPPFDRDPVISISFLRSIVTVRVADQATRVGIAVDVATDGAEVEAAVAAVVDRALRVAWALNGPVRYRVTTRQGLGWITSHAMRDPPRRPVNVPCAPWPMSDTMVTVEAHDGPVTLRTRYAVAGARDVPLERDVADSLPLADQPPVIDPEARVIVYLHGHSSMVEEALSLYDALKNENRIVAESGAIRARDVRLPQ